MQKWTQKRSGIYSNAAERSTHSFCVGDTPTSGTPTNQKNRQHTKKEANTSTVHPRSQSNQNKRKGKSKDPTKVTPSSGWITQHPNTSAKDSLKFGVTYHRTHRLIEIQIDEYLRKSTGKQMEMYVKINICCDGKRIVDKRRKYKTRRVRSTTKFEYNKTLKITGEEGFEDKHLLVAVWEYGSVRHTFVSGILIDIDGSSNSIPEWRDLKSKSEIKKAILETAKQEKGLLPVGETDSGDQQSNIILEQSPKCSSGNKADGNERTHNSKRIGVVSKPKGLPNLGNTCYANSVLQVLCQTPGFKEDLETHVQNSTAKYLLDVLYHEGEQSIRRLLDTVFESDDSFHLGKQNDSHSFLLALFASIQEDTSNKACRLFEGSMLSRYTYTTCSHEEDTEQLFTSLLMPITEHKNLQGCIQEVCKEEVFPRNVIHCRLCSSECTMGKDKTETKKKILFATLPEILVFQMGRFEERKVSTSTFIQKKTTNITFEREIQLYEETNQSLTRYCLYGVVNHGGSIHGGHYTACVKVCGNITETWYNCSDANVSVTSDPSCQSSAAAYLLFYHRVQRS